MRNVRATLKSIVKSIRKTSSKEIEVLFLISYE